MTALTLLRTIRETMETIPPTLFDYTQIYGTPGEAGCIAHHMNLRHGWSTASFCGPMNPAEHAYLLGAGIAQRPDIASIEPEARSYWGDAEPWKVGQAGLDEALRRIDVLIARHSVPTPAEQTFLNSVHSASLETAPDAM